MQDEHIASRAGESSGKVASFSLVACPSQAAGSSPARSKGVMGTPHRRARGLLAGRAELGTAGEGAGSWLPQPRAHSWMKEGGAASAHTFQLPPHPSSLFSPVPMISQAALGPLLVPTPRILQGSEANCRDPGMNVQKPTSTGTAASTNTHTHTQNHPQLQNTGTQDGADRGCSTSFHCKQCHP